MVLLLPSIIESVSYRLIQSISMQAHFHSTCTCVRCFHVLRCHGNRTSLNRDKWTRHTLSVSLSLWTKWLTLFHTKCELCVPAERLWSWTHHVVQLRLVCLIKPQKDLSYLPFVIAILTKHNHTVDLTLNFYQGKITQFFFWRVVSLWLYMFPLYFRKSLGLSSYKIG